MNSSENNQGMLWIIASCLAATVMSLGLKLLSGEVHSTQIVLIRCLFGLVIIFPLLFRGGFKALKSVQTKLHFFRGICAAFAINFGFFSLTVLPLATATVLFFTAPLFVILLAMIIYKEQVGWRRLAATFAGFLGTIVVVNPSFETFDFNLLVPILSSVFFAVSLILNKQLSKTDSPAVSMFYMFTIVSIASLPFALYHWIWPDFSQWQILLLVISIFATLRTYFDIRAYTIGQASFVASFQYIRIIFIGIAAYLVFSEVPERHVIIGALVIISSSLYIVQREYRLKSKVIRPIENYG